MVDFHRPRSHILFINVSLICATMPKSTETKITCSITYPLSILILHNDWLKCILNNQTMVELTDNMISGHSTLVSVFNVTSKTDMQGFTDTDQSYY